MKRFFFVFVILNCLAAFAAAQEYGETDVGKFRKLRDEQFRNRTVSPLRPADFATFESLSYFPTTESFRVKAIFTSTPNEKSFMMPTSAGFSHKYIKVGDLKFELDGKEFSLNAYRREYEPTDARAKQPNDNLFVPFKDLTNGAETYGGGRYIFLKTPKDAGATVLDFNLAFNPSCAYGDPSFSCPIPPKDNFLKVEIKAGEKIYKRYGAQQE